VIEEDSDEGRADDDTCCSKPLFSITNPTTERSRTSTYKKLEISFNTVSPRDFRERNCSFCTPDKTAESKPQTNNDGTKIQVLNDNKRNHKLSNFLDEIVHRDSDLIVENNTELTIDPNQVKITFFIF
jgi:hypothetical protein